MRQAARLILRHKVFLQDDLQPRPTIILARIAPKKIGYARVSTKRQKLDLQLEALQAAKCDLIIAEKTGGLTTAKRGLAAAIASCKPGDELVVWRLDRLSRDMFEVVDVNRLLRKQGVRLTVLTGQAAALDTTQREGAVMLGLFAAFAEFEHGATSERVSAGRAVARLRKARPKRITARSAVRRPPAGHGHFANQLRCAFNRKR
ncbi:MAG: recombinase family protein [Parvibaculaceae bacterium]